MTNYAEDAAAGWQLAVANKAKRRLGIRPELTAMQLEDRRWVVRPVGQLGTVGWASGFAWTAQYVSAPTAKDAIRKAGSSVYDTIK